MKMPPVEIQWCDHSSVLLEYLRQLYEEGRFVDVGLECEGRQVKAHKAVISACSPYLEGLLKGNPARSHLIKFNGYSYNSLKAVIDFMYNGKVMVEQDNLAAFLKLGRALQVRGILDIAAQCEAAGLTTPEETKSNAQYSTTVQQSQKNSHPKHQQNIEGKKYAFLMDKSQKKTGAQRRAVPNIIGSVDQQPPQVNKVTAAQAAAQVAQQQVQEQQTQVLQQQTSNQTVDTTLEELQAALASGNALIQATDPNGGEQTLQMMEGQCVVTGSGQTYVVVQDGDNLSFVPAEMVQGDLQAAVNGGQVMETLENVDEQFAAHMQGQVLQQESQALENAGVQEDSGSLDTMSVVESLVKLGQKQPNVGAIATGTTGTEETPEVGPDMPDLGGDNAEEETTVDEPEAIDNDSEEKNGVKRTSETFEDGPDKKIRTELSSQ